MNRINHLSLLFVLLAFLTSCAGNEVVPSSVSLHTEKHLIPIVKIDSFIDQEHKSEEYSQPVVWVRIASVEDMLILENSIIKGFRSHDINPVPGAVVFPPGVKITRELIVSSFQQSGGDSLFIISLKPGSTLYHMEYDATLYGDRLDKVWIGHVVTDLQQTDSTNAQIGELMFQTTAHEIINQVIKDGVVLKGN